MAIDAVEETRDTNSMRKYVRFLFITLTIATLVPQPSFAVDTMVLTDAQISAIQANCQMVKVNLESLHGNDAVFYVNLSQRYHDIARRLMAPMNSRIALNGLDGVELTKTTVQYNDGLQSFSEQYATYEASLQRAINIDCSVRPVEFYSAVSVARVNRQALAEVVDQMYELGGQYAKQIESFKATLTAEGAA